MAGILHDINAFLDQWLPPSTPGADYKGMVLGVTLTLVFFFLIYLSSRVCRVDDATYKQTIEKHGLLGKQFLVLTQNKYGKSNSVNKEFFDEMRREKLRVHYEKKDAKKKEKEDTDWLVKEIMEKRGKPKRD